MSRIGKLPISIPDGVEVKVDGNTVSVKSKKGDLKQEIHPTINIEVKDGNVVVTRQDDSKQSLSYHGLYRSLINNMIEGVSKGFKKSLEINGVGYKAELKGQVLNLALGYSHPIDFQIPDGIKVEVDKTGRNVVLEGIDKQLVGQVAANIRSFRKPEPYKGKGVKYTDETIIRKEGKTK